MNGARFACARGSPLAMQFSFWYSPCAETEGTTSGGVIGSVPSEPLLK